MDSRKAIHESKMDYCFTTLTNPLDCHDFATQNLAMTGGKYSLQNHTNYTTLSSLRVSKTNEAIRCAMKGVQTKLAMTGDDSSLRGEAEVIHELNLQDSVLLKPFTKDI